MDALTLALGAVATWRIAHMLLKENGPFEVFRTVRIKLGVAYYADTDEVLASKYEITVCIWCLSMWVGVATAAALWAWSWFVWLLVPYVFSAVAVWIDSLMQFRKKSG